MNKLERIQIARGAYFNSVRDDRFKTMEIEANIIMPLSAETASENALLSYVLSRSCAKYPTYRALCKKLGSLYGAELSTSVVKAGDRQVISLTLTGLDDRYALDGESIARQLSQLLCEVIFEPNAKDGAFESAELEQERRQLLDVIDSEFNEKRIYANAKMIEHMCADEVFGIKRYGSAEKIKNVTPQSLYAAWLNMLENAEFEIMYIGDSAPDKAIEVFTREFGRFDRSPSKTETQVIKRTESVKRVSESMDVSQSKLVMGFRAGRALPESVVATQLMTAVLGGTASSKLFCNVREKQSLCYYCAARYDKFKGIMVIDSGVEGENIEKLEKGILKEIEDMKNGVISDFEIEATKLAVINSYRSSNDTVRGINNWYTNQIFDTDIKTIEETAELVRAVTKEQIVEAARALTLDTVYALKNN